MAEHLSLDFASLHCQLAYRYVQVKHFGLGFEISSASLEVFAGLGRILHTSPSLAGLGKIYLAQRSERLTDLWDPYAGLVEVPWACASTARAQRRI